MVGEIRTRIEDTIAKCPLVNWEWGLLPGLDLYCLSHRHLKCKRYKIDLLNSSHFPHCTLTLAPNVLLWSSHQSLETCLPVARVKDLSIDLDFLLPPIFFLSLEYILLDLLNFGNLSRILPLLPMFISTTLSQATMRFKLLYSYLLKWPPFFHPCSLLSALHTQRE